MTTKTNVGTYKEDSGDVYRFGKARQLYIFWGLVPIGRAHAETPSSGSCQVVTKMRFGDFLISGLTAGILTSYSIKVYAKKQK